MSTRLGKIDVACICAILAVGMTVLGSGACGKPSPADNPSSAQQQESPRGIRGYLSSGQALEARSNLQALFVGLSTYYASEQWQATGVLEPGGVLPEHTHCTVEGERSPEPPSEHKHVVDWARLPSFEAANFNTADPCYFQYEISGGPSQCEGAPGRVGVYTLIAHEDVDGDGELGRVELRLSTNGENELCRGRELAVFTDDGRSGTIALPDDEESRCGR